MLEQIDKLFRIKIFMERITLSFRKGNKKLLKCECGCEGESGPESRDYEDVDVVTRGFYY